MLDQDPNVRTSKGSAQMLRVMYEWHVFVVGSAFVSLHGKSVCVFTCSVLMCCDVHVCMCLVLVHMYVVCICVTEFLLRLSMAREIVQV